MTDRHRPSSTPGAAADPEQPAAAVAGEVGRRAVPELCIAEDDPARGDVRHLADRHLDFANRHSTPEDVHALGPDELSDPGVTVFSARGGDGRLLGLGALRELDPGHGELKSMHTVEEARHRGVGRALLVHLLRIARRRGYERVSLETGAMAAFAPARAMYRAAGFERCAPFAGYPVSPNSVWMTLRLAPPHAGARGAPGRITGAGA